MIRVTKIFIIAALAAIIFFDVVAVVVGGGNATISTTLMNWSKTKYGPIIVFLSGALMYHLFVCE